MKKFFLILGIFLLFDFSALCQKQKKGHDIKINIKGWNDEFCLLAHYFGNGQYLDDTLWIQNDAVRIKGDTSLRSGMYLLINQNKSRILEFFIDKNQQHFTIESDTIDLVGHLKVNGSESNQRFFGWMQFLNMIRKVGDQYKAEADSFRKVENFQQAAFYQAKFDSVTNLYEKKWEELFTTDSSLLVSKFMISQKGIDVPKTKPDGTPSDQLYQYQYLKSHFFDNINLADIEMLYTTVYHKAIEQYFEKIIPQIPDSVIEEGLKLFNLAKENLETRYYVAWYVTSFAESSKLMGMDGAFVRFVDDFYASGSVDGMVMPAMKEMLMKRADEMRLSLIGKIAPNIAAWDTAERVRHLNHIRNKYTIVFFFSTTCGHCKSEAQELKKIYAENKNTYDFEVFAVCTDSSMTQLKKYIKKNEIPWIVVNGSYTASRFYKDVYDIPTTPSLFLLDHNKKIIAKNLNAENTFEFLKEYDKFYIRKE